MKPASRIFKLADSYRGKPVMFRIASLKQPLTIRPLLTKLSSDLDEIARAINLN